MSSPTAQSVGLYGYMFTFPLGFIGHIFSLVTFSAYTLRTTSTGFLFLCLTLSDIVYQLMSIHDFVVQVLRLSTFKSEYLCRFRTFILNFSTFSSSWILVLITMDRLVRVRLPHQQKRICTPRVAALSIVIICICSIGFTSHVLLSEFGFSNPISKLCGPNRTSMTIYSIFYFNTLPILQLIITYLLPSCIMIISLIFIRTIIGLQQNQFVRSRRREKVEQQMFILMFSSIICFSICTLSYSIHRIVYQRSEVTSQTQLEIAILTIFLNINYCYNFYIHCLTSNLFRHKFIEQIRLVFITRNRPYNNTVFPFSTVTAPHRLPTN